MNSNMMYTPTQMKSPEDLEKLLYCAVCKNLYNNPKTLPCFHSFCARCLQETLYEYEEKPGAKLGKLRCPACKEKVFVPSFDIDDIRADHKVFQFEQFLNAITGQPPRHHGDADDPLEGFHNDDQNGRFTGLDKKDYSFVNPAIMAESRENLVELTKCSICMESFNHAKSLSCFHTFCANCIDKCYKEHQLQYGSVPGHLFCPTCRDDVELPKKDVNKLPTDFKLYLLNDFLENFKGRPKGAPNAYQPPERGRERERRAPPPQSHTNGNAVPANQPAAAPPSQPQMRNQGMYLPPAFTPPAATMERARSPQRPVNRAQTMPTEPEPMGRRERLQRALSPPGRTPANYERWDRGPQAQTLPKPESNYSRPPRVRSPSPNNRAQRPPPEPYRVDRARSPSPLRQPMPGGDSLRDRIQRPRSPPPPQQQPKPAPWKIRPATGPKPVNYEFRSAALPKNSNYEHRPAPGPNSNYEHRPAPGPKPNYKQDEIFAREIPQEPQQFVPSPMGGLPREYSRQFETYETTIPRSMYGGGGAGPPPLPQPRHNNMPPPHNMYSAAPADYIHPRGPGQRQRQILSQPELIFEFDLRERIDDPNDITFVPNGDFVIADRRNANLQLHRHTGQFLFSIADQKVIPWAVDVTVNGNLAVLDHGQRCIKIFDWQSKELGSLGSFVYPCSMAVNQRNEFIVTDTRKNTITILDPAGKHLTTFVSRDENEDFARSDYVAVDSLDRIILSDCSNHCIKIFDHRGKFIDKFGMWGDKPGELKYPNGVCTDIYDNIIVADKWNHRISMFDPDGNFKCHLLDRSVIQDPCAVAMDQEGRLLITECSFDSVALHSMLKMFQIYE